MQPTNLTTDLSQTPDISLPTSTPQKSMAPAMFLFRRPTDDQIRQSSVMIVDDEEMVALAVQKYLKQAGFKSFQLVTDATRAVTEIRRTLPDLIMLDLKMPIHGLAILEMLRNDEHMQHIPVIIFTSETETKTKIKALNLGADDFLTKPVDASELVARVRNTLVGKVSRDELARYSTELESNALLDELTQISNRRAFHYELERRMVEWNRRRTPLSLLMIDIDFFKRINDQYGHPAGDRALRTLAQQIGHCVREMDLVARYGGEEFAVILPSTGPNDARNTAERIRHSIASKTWQFDEHQFNITVSVGIATAMNGDEVSMLVRRADTALYAAKRGGRNQSSFHDGAQCRLLGTTDESSENFIATTGSGEPADEIKKSKILIVDDEPSTLLMVKKLLKDVGYSNVYTESQSVRAVGLIEKELPDLVLLDIRMPEVNGLEVLQRVRENEKTKHIPIVFLTSTTETETKIQALDLGANDFLQKPINKSEVVARVRNSLLAKAHVDHLAHYSIQLEHEVQLRTAELYASRREAIQCLARAAEIRDDETGQHVVRVGRYAAILAKEMGFSNERVIWLEHAAQLHDVGKIGVPDEILKKPSKLSEEEFEVMRQHCQVGSQIIRDDGAPDSAALKSHANLGASIFDNCNSPVMRMAAVVAESHHEKWDGTGYPNGLAEENIPIEGRITAVADVFDALSTKRHYKSAIPLGECFSIINDGKGKHFDPDVVDAFLRRKIDILEVFYAYNEDQAASDHQGTTQISE